MPEYALLDPGDKVVVDTQHGHKEAEVVATISAIEPTSEEFTLICMALNIDLPLRRVLSKINYKPMRYEDD